MKRIGIVEDKFTATSWYRTHGPLAMLYKECRDFEIINLDSTVNYRDLLKLDIILISRPNGSSYLSLINTCKRLGIKVWIDLDDDIYNIPVHNPAYFTYQDKEGISECLNLADIITVSTAHLAIIVNENINKECVVLHNAVDTSKLPEYTKPENITFAWRGSDTHMADLDSQKEYIIALSKRFNITFYGYAPHWHINFEYVKGSNLFDFYNIFYNSKTTFLLTPLEKIEFNYSKSNIAFLEATMAGAVCITNLTTKEWNWECILKFSNDLISAPEKKLIELHNTQFEIAKKVISECYNIHEINKERHKIIHNI